MKRVYDLTEEEILSLTEEQISHYVDVECALEGIKLIPQHPGPEPVNEVPEKDHVAYEVVGLKFLNSEDANKVLQLISPMKIYESTYHRNYDLRYLKRIEPDDYNFPKVQMKKYYKEETATSISGLYEVYKKKKETWDKLKKEYDEATNGVEGIRKEIRNHIYDVTAHARQRSDLMNEFNRYLSLSEDNPRIALNFLEKVRVLEEFPEVKEQIDKLIHDYELQSNTQDVQIKSEDTNAA